MANPAVEINGQTRRAVLYFTATGSANIAGNNSVSDIAVGQEVVNAAQISQVWFGMVSNTFITINRGGNVSSNLVLSGTGHMQFSERGAPLMFGNISGNVVVTFTGGGPGFVRIDLQKICNSNIQQSIP